VPIAVGGAVVVVVGTFSERGFALVRAERSARAAKAAHGSCSWEIIMGQGLQVLEERYRRVWWLDDADGFLAYV